LVRADLYLYFQLDTRGGCCRILDGPTPSPLPRVRGRFQPHVIRRGEEGRYGSDWEPRAAVARDHRHTLPDPGLPSLALTGHTTVKARALAHPAVGFERAS